MAASEGMPTWLSGHQEENQNNNQKVEDGQGIDNSEMAIPNSVTNSGSDGPVEHLLHAIGVIFGNTVSTNQNNTTVNCDADHSKQMSTVSPDANKKLLDNERNVSSSYTSYVCKTCNEKFSKKTDLKQHNFTHTGHLKYKCDFEDCGWSFHTKYKLERHMMVHSSNKKYTCPVEQCGKSFAEAYSLKVHVESHSKIYKCPVNGCNQEFATSRKLQLHRQKYHEIKPYKCTEDKCYMEFDTAAKLNDHIATHITFICPECNKSFNRKSLLEIHLRSHTNDRPFKCTEEDCNAAFTTAYKLNRHMKNHSDARPFSCTFDGCHAKFKRQDHLRKHVAQHKGEKPFVCPVDGCPSKFTALASLKNHMLGHTKQYRFTCPIQGCNREYFSKHTFNCHVKRHQAKVEENANSAETQTDSTCVIFVGLQPNASVSSTEAIISTQPTVTSANESLILSKRDVTSAVGSNDAVMDTSSQFAVVALGEAACFQYINETSCDKSKTSSSSGGKQSNATKATEKVIHDTCKASIVKKPVLTTSTGKSQSTNKLDKDNTFPQNAATDVNLPGSHHNHQFAPSANDVSRLDFTSSIFGGESVAVPLSMTRFLPQELQTAEYLSNEYRNDHSYNRTLLSTDPSAFVTLDSRNVDSAIEKSLNVSDFEGHFNEVSDPMMEMRSLLVENGMASFLANDDIGRMETCAANEDDLTMNRKFDRNVSHDVAMMIEDCVMERRPSSLSSGFSHYSAHDSYVSSLMESSHTVSEHLLNISSNPTMVDHMYSQLGPEEDELQIVTEDHAYEESTVNIQDIR